MKYILALDQGTSSSRSVIFDKHARPVAAAQREFTQHFPRPGWVEHDAGEIWRSMVATAKDALVQAGLTAADLAAIGITNQRETTVLWDRETGEPVHHAIVWQDRRTAGMLEDMRRDGVEPLVQQRTGLLLDPYFAASKLRWLLDELPGVRQKAAAGRLAAGTIDSWLVFQLTRGARHITDVTNASRTMLMNLRTGDWDDELLALFNIPRGILPEIVPSGGALAVTAPEVLGGAVPVTGIAGDQQAALFGQLCTEPGLAKNTFGTGCFMLLFTGDRPVPSRNRLLTTVAWKLEGGALQYALEGSVFVGGAAIQWLRDGLGIIRSAPEVNELAAKVPDTGGAFLVPAFTGLGAPYWDPTARGALVGMTRGTTAAHLARATLEGIAFQVADLLGAMQTDSGRTLAALRVDGGASASDLLMQMQADFLGVPVERPAYVETTALGAAFMAGLAAGVWSSVDSLASTRTVDRTFSPAIGAAERQARLHRWHRAVECARGWADE